MRTVAVLKGDTAAPTYFYQLAAAHFRLCSTQHFLCEEVKFMKSKIHEHQIRLSLSIAILQIETHLACAIALLYTCGSHSSKGARVKSYSYHQVVLINKKCILLK